MADCFSLLSSGTRFQGNDKKRIRKQEEASSQKKRTYDESALDFFGDFQDAQERKHVGGAGHEKNMEITTKKHRPRNSNVQPSTKLMESESVNTHVLREGERRREYTEDQETKQEVVVREEEEYRLFADKPAISLNSSSALGKLRHGATAGEKRLGRAQAARERVSAFRKRLGIRVDGDKCPPPITTFDEVAWMSEASPTPPIKAHHKKNVSSQSADFSRAQSRTRDAVLAAIEGSIWKEPTAVQMQAIPVLCAGRDLVASAPTGSGKTAAFVIPALVKMAGLVDSRFAFTNSSAVDKGFSLFRPRALLLAPTNELAAQIHREAMMLGTNAPVNVELLTKAKIASLATAASSIARESTLSPGSDAGGSGPQDSAKTEMWEDEAGEDSEGSDGSSGEEGRRRRRGRHVNRIAEIKSKRASTKSPAMSQNEKYRRAGAPVLLVTTPMRLVAALHWYGNRNDSSGDCSVIDLSAVELVVLDEADRLLELETDCESGPANADGMARDGDISSIKQKKKGEKGKRKSLSSAKEGLKKGGSDGIDLAPAGFLGQIDEVLGACNHPKVQRALFSATMGPRVQQLVDAVLRQPVRVTVGVPQAGNSNIEQRLTFVGREEGKVLAFRQLIQRGEMRPPALIFVQSKERAKQLHSELASDGIKVDAIHSDRNVEERDAVVRDFRLGKVWVLVTTDLLARGVDFKGVNMVVNFDFPPSSVAYIHRIGRTGRAGRKGLAVTFFTEADMSALRSIANVVKLSGGNVPSWMLGLNKERRDVARRREIKAPHRKRIVSTGIKNGSPEEARSRKSKKKKGKRAA